MMVIFTLTLKVSHDLKYFTNYIRYFTSYLISARYLGLPRYSTLRHVETIKRSSVTDYYFSIVKYLD